VIKQYLFNLLEIHFSIKSVYLLPEDDIMALAWDVTGDIGDVEFYSEIDHRFLFNVFQNEKLCLVMERGIRLIDLVRFLDGVSRTNLHISEKRRCHTISHSNV
jgi:hypothetical protein